MDERMTPPPDIERGGDAATKDALCSPFRIETNANVGHSYGAETPIDSPNSQSSTVNQAPRGPNLETNFPAHALNQIFCPRPYEEIYSERAYLTSLLQQKSQRVAYLIGSYSSVEQRLATSTEARSRKKLRKKLGVLEFQMSEATEQEKVMCIRLGELQLELHVRDSWAQALRDRVTAAESCNSYAPWMYLVPPTPVASAPTPTPLDPESPVFVPRSRRSDSPQVHAHAWAERKGAGFGNLGTALETVEENAEEIIEEDAKDDEERNNAEDAEENAEDAGVATEPAATEIVADEKLEYEYHNEKNHDQHQCDAERFWWGEAIVFRQRSSSLPNLHCLWLEA